MEKRRAEGIVEAAVTSEDGIAYHKVYFSSVFSKEARFIEVADSDLEAAGVDLVTDYGPGAQPLVEAFIDLEANSPGEVLPEGISAVGYLPSLDDKFTLQNYYGKE